jgi:hypothetical protein
MSTVVKVGRLLFMMTFMVFETAVLIGLFWTSQKFWTEPTSIIGVTLAIAIFVMLVWQHQVDRSSVFIATLSLLLLVTASTWQEVDLESVNWYVAIVHLLAIGGFVFGFNKVMQSLPVTLKKAHQVTNALFANEFLMWSFLVFPRSRPLVWVALVLATGYLGFELWQVLKSVGQSSYKIATSGV